MAQTNARIIDMQGVKNVMNSRALIRRTEIGKSIKAFIQGNGNVIDVKRKDGATVGQAQNPEVVLQKTIFNLKANSDIAMSNQRNRDILKEAVTLEKAGKKEEASAKYNEYLNKTQVSISLLNTGAQAAIAALLNAGAEVAGTVQLIEGPNGELLTLDASTIRIVEAQALGKTTFDLDDFLGEEGVTADEATAVGATADEAAEVVA